jgi:hypothetical protein
VVETKYDSKSRGWYSKEAAEPFEVGVWKFMMGWGVFLRFRYEMGDGTKIRLA